MDILCIIPARSGSKGIKHKNIKNLAGKPLMSWSIEQALQSKYKMKVLVSTDSEEYRQIAIKYGAEAPFLRPNEFSTDEASSVSAMQHAVDWVEQQEGIKYDYIVELMCTNPMKSAEDIDASIEKLISTQADSVIAVHQLEDHHPARIKKIVDDKIVDFCIAEILESRRQDLKPKAYIRSGSIYALKRDYLMIDGNRYGSDNSRPYILPQERAVNIDTEVDFMIAELMLNK